MNLIRIAYVQDLGVAMVINSLLESEGCIIADSAVGHLSRSGANQGSFIAVADCDLEKAAAILKEHGFAEFLLTDSKEIM